ncbi:peptidase inhibitor I9 [Blastococcus colisei]|uniref:Peptidase inhibitor I9 n=1 Tax=Blastococcus colisei TaxID=1564162 RepID=A0A543P0R6_9ACTN|nr:S8 family serine peptidase [Blastococcus colisei]TQN37702.1 peptidase inhibitor I9 [Blastococcus colisei]
MSHSAVSRRGSRLLAAAALSFTALAAFAPTASAAPPPPTPHSIPGAWIVTLEPGQAPDRVSAEHGRRHGAQVDHLYRHALTGYAARMSDQAAARVAQDPRVASVERDQIVTAFAPRNKTVVTPVAQTLPTGIDRIDGDLSDTLSGDGKEAVDVDVAVIDTGIDVDHPDLNVVGGKNCVTGGRSYDDGNGHGTHVAGTIAAKDDANGVVGVAPGARLWAVRVLNNQGSGTRSGIICGVDWVSANRSTIEVANMSLGGSGTEPTAEGCSTGDSYHDAICRSVAGGVTYVVAAGNSSADAATAVPAAYDEVVTVSALADFDGKPGALGASTCRADVDDTFADFSNFGADVDLIAPGVCIHSTWMGGGYDTISGTSMASPHVAGAAALIKAATPTATPDGVRTALVAGGDLDWDNGDDRDPVKETLLSVAGY